jgi:hypothetical protein
LSGAYGATSADTNTYVGSDGIAVQLTGFSLAYSSTTNLVSAFNNAGRGIFPGNYVGTLDLVQAPEPTTLPLAGGAVLALLAAIRRSFV